MTIRTLIAFLSLSIVTAALFAALPPDAEANKLLVGVWVIPREEYAATSKDGGFTFRADGTFSSYAVFRIHEQDLRVEVEGKWSVKDGALIEEITKSSHPQMVAVGAVTRDTLLSVTAREYRFRSKHNNEHRYVRK